MPLISEKFYLRKFYATLFIFSAYFSTYGPVSVNCLTEEEIVAKWGNQIGSELWQLGNMMTRSNEIKEKYRFFVANVRDKDTSMLLKEIVGNVTLMLKRKIEAVNDIMETAEEAARDKSLYYDLDETVHGYYSSKFSKVILESKPEYDDSELYLDGTPNFKPNSTNYFPMYVENDTHFYSLLVNTTHSAVQVPTNIYDYGPEVIEDILWSAQLDPVFVDNYKRDPALSWQYFGTDTGILRLYPAMRWNDEMWNTKKVDAYDCRKRSWYIETATCSKDIVILLDISGSMTGYKNFVSQLTIKIIFDSFSNNDFVNVFRFAEETEPVIPCIDNQTLVQATPENLDEFLNVVKNLTTGGFARIDRALNAAFKLLQTYRIRKNCDLSASGCNQAIMLITDGVNSNFSSIFDEYNWFESELNTTNKPVRVFIYALGRDVVNLNEMTSMACNNRGYYSHVRTLDEVAEEVLKYVNVIARPLVLQQREHPPTWTHAFADLSSEVDDVNVPPRLMIAVGVPAFGVKPNTSEPYLLGVAATDVPVEDIDKLTLPFKLGVNGYSFIVSNNGYVLLHPNLEPVFTVLGRLKRNYNSIDFIEVEQEDNSNPPRIISEKLLELRRKLVMGETGSTLNLPVKFHYDKKRRVSHEMQDYHYAPLEGTPFSLGLVLPSGYGNTWMHVGKEIEKNTNRKVKVSSFFEGQNWKINKDWVYCKYHYLEGHEFDSSEDELRHFLDKVQKPNWKWYEQYNLNATKLDSDTYYCNRELVELLVFDAKVTKNIYTNWEFTNEAEKKLFEKFNSTIRFIATMSGLTRWQYILGEVEVEDDMEFGDYYSKAIEESWYKSAVLQHRIDPNSFVYSVPHDEDADKFELKITASHAIFHRDGIKEVPSCVVGFQFTYGLMYKRFMQITSEKQCDGSKCMGTCNDDSYDCFLIDHNGYIVVSKFNKTGHFFGEIAGDIMISLVKLKIFEKITVFDYQALCKKSDSKTSFASSLMNPVHWILGAFKILLLQIVNFWATVNSVAVDSFVPSRSELEAEEEEAEINQIKSKLTTTPSPLENITVPASASTLEQMKLYSGCDKYVDLYVLNQTKLIAGNGSLSIKNEYGTRSYYLKRIPNSNLIFIMVNLLDNRNEAKLKATLETYEYPEKELACRKLSMNELPRRRLEECFTSHPQEAYIKECAKGSTLTITKWLTILMSIIILCRSVLVT